MVTPRLQCLRPSPQMPTQACSCGLCRLTASEAPPRATARVGGCEVSWPGRAGALVPTPGGSPCSVGLPRAAHLYAGCRGLGTLFPQPPAGMGTSSPRLPTQTPPEKAAGRRDPIRSLPASIWGGPGFLGCGGPTAAGRPCLVRPPEHHGALGAGIQAGGWRGRSLAPGGSHPVEEADKIRLPCDRD